MRRAARDTDDMDGCLIRHEKGHAEEMAPLKHISMVGCIIKMS